MERGRLVRTGIAGILPARRASCPALYFRLNGGQDARRAAGTSAIPVRAGCPRSRKMPALQERNFSLSPRLPVFLPPVLVFLV